MISLASFGFDLGQSRIWRTVQFWSFQFGVEAKTLNAPVSITCAGCPVRGSSICSVLDQSDLEEQERSARRVRLAARTTLFVEGEVATSFYTLREGVVRLHKLLLDGRRQIVGFSMAGDFLGVTSSHRHQFSAVAVTPVAFCKCSRATFTRFIEKRPHLMQRINELIVRELSQAQVHIVLVGQGSAEEKIAGFLIGWRDRLARLHGAKDVIDLPMGRQDIADYLGLTIETVSRTLNRFERDGVIQIVPGGVRLLDTERAEGLAAA